MIALHSKPVTLLLSLIVSIVGGTAQGQERPVALELLLAVDCSSSVSNGEFDLQMQGIAAAFRHPAVHEAIKDYAAEGIAVGLVQWSSTSNQKLSVDWALVDDQASAEAFAAATDRQRRSVGGGRTAIGEAIVFSLAEMETNEFDGARKVVDVSGDGLWNQGRPPEEAKLLAEASGTTINGLAVLSLEPGLADHYRDSVITGPEAFVITARRYSDFAEAILRKLLREIVGPRIASEPAALGLAEKSQRLGVRGRSATRASAPRRRRSGRLASRLHPAGIRPGPAACRVATRLSVPR